MVIVLVFASAQFPDYRIVSIKCTIFMYSLFIEHGFWENAKQTFLRKGLLIFIDIKVRILKNVQFAGIN